MRRLVLLIAGCLLWVQFLHPALHLADERGSNGHHVHCTLCQNFGMPATLVVLPSVITEVAPEYPVKTPQAASAPAPNPRGRAPPQQA